MSRKPEDRDLLRVSEIKSLPISLQQRASSSNKPNQAQQANTAVKKRGTSKGNVVSVALCTHLGINIGVKGPTAFELYRALGGRKRR